MGTGRGPWWNQRDEKAGERREVSAQRKSKGAASPGPSPTPEGSARPPYVSARVRQEGFSWMEVSVPPRGTGAPGTSSCREGASQPGRKMLSPAGRPRMRTATSAPSGLQGDTFGREGRTEPFCSAKVRETRTLSFLLPPGSVKLFRRASRDQFSEVPRVSCPSISSQTLVPLLTSPKLRAKITSPTGMLRALKDNRPCKVLNKY